jgi:hypothetical protein
MNDFLSEKQKENITFFHENLETWAANPLYKLKFVVIVEKEMKGLFDTFDAALNDAVAKFPSGDYIIQQIISEQETVNFLYPALALA